MKKVFLVILSLVMFGSCKKKTHDAVPVSSDKTAIGTYGDIASATYQDCYDGAVVLQTAIIDFCSNPTAEKFANLKVLYANARVPYEQSEPFRTANGPIDTGDDAVEGRLNSWPLSENFVDYVQGANGKDSLSGIINDSTGFPEITKDMLIANHESGGESNLTLGYHVIEFLLWGQDLNPDSARNSAGQRKYTDYTTKANYKRRKAYLLTATQILVGDLAYVADQWRTDGPYRTKFLAKTDAENLSDALSGIAWFTIGELPTERMLKAVTNKDQEEEHSCFSDLTDQDIKLSMKGVSNLINGTYTKTNGDKVGTIGLIKVLEERDAAGAQKVLTLLNTAIANCAQIKAPFDQTIINDGGTVVKAEKSVIDFSNKLQDVCAKVGITLNISE